MFELSIIKKLAQTAIHLTGTHRIKVISIQVNANIIGSAKNWKTLIKEVLQIEETSF